MKPKFLLLQKAEAVEDEDGVLTPAGMAVAQTYATDWTANGVRDLEMERKYPQLVGLFYDIRNDAELAREHAGKEISVKKSLDETVVMVRAEIQTVPLGVLMKAGGPYIGPRGGKWADPEFTIHWEDRHDAPAKGAKQDERKESPQAPAKPESQPADSQKEMFPEKQVASIKIEHKMVPLNPNKPPFKGTRTTVPHFEGLPTETHQAYKTPDGQYIPERQRLHQEIFTAAMEGKTPVPPNQKPVAIVMMGGGASGKSTLVRREFGDKGLLGNFVMINSDDVKEQLPEYDMATKDPNHTATDAAKMVHEESSDVAKKILATATDKNSPHNIVFDGTGASVEGYKRMIEGLKAKGYHVNLIFADVPNPEDAVQRAMARAHGSGRFVPEDVIREAHELIPPNYEKLIPLVDSHAMFALDENNKPHRPIMSGSSGRHDISDPTYLSQFRERSQKLEVVNAKRRADREAQKQAEMQGTSPPPIQVAKSMYIWQPKGAMKKAFPQQQQQPKFTMRPRPPAAAGTPPPGSPNMAPGAAPSPPGMAPQRPPMPPAAGPPPAPGQPPPAGAPMAPRPPQAPPVPGRPPAPPMAPPVAPMAPRPAGPNGMAPPPGQPAVSGQVASAAPDSRPPSVAFEDIMAALSKQKVDPQWEESSKSEIKDYPKGFEYPSDDFMWAAEAVNPSSVAPGTQPPVPQKPVASPSPAPAQAAPSVSTPASSRSKPV
jgi:predicted ABC-type ATPase